MHPDIQGWKDVSIHGYPKSGSDVLMVRSEKTIYGAFIGDSFWYNNEKIAVLYWRYLPDPPVFKKRTTGSEL